jgi:hypothetical protein
VRATVTGAGGFPELAGLLVLGGIALAGAVLAARRALGRAAVIPERPRTAALPPHPEAPGQDAGQYGWYAEAMRRAGASRQEALRQAARRQAVPPAPDNIPPADRALGIAAAAMELQLPGRTWTRGHP